MRNFVVTIDGKSYSVGVEEVDGTKGSRFYKRRKSLVALPRTY